MLQARQGMLVQLTQPGVDSWWCRENLRNQGRKEIPMEQRNVDHRSFSSSNLSFIGGAQQCPLGTNGADNSDAARNRPSSNARFGDSRASDGSQRIWRFRVPSLRRVRLILVYCLAPRCHVKTNKCKRQRHCTHNTINKHWSLRMRAIQVYRKSK